MSTKHYTAYVLVGVAGTAIVWLTCGFFAALGVFLMLYGNNMAEWWRE